jgi:hypothetical protein
MWGFDTSVPNVARIYDYLLGGKDNFEVDRVAAEAILKVVPTAALSARQNRAFLARVVTWVAAEAGVRQFLDIGSGLPTHDNAHQVAQRAAWNTKVLYVDADPLVVTHARALMTSDIPGHTVDVAQGNLLDPGEIIAQAQQFLDFTQPVAVLLVAVLQFVEDASDPWHVVKTLVDAVPPGSYLVMSHATADGFEGADSAAAVLQSVYARSAAGGVTGRTRGEVLRFFDGLELVEPGLVDVARWHQDNTAGSTYFYGCVARKPPRGHGT